MSARYKSASLLAAVCAAVVGLAACGSSGKSTSATTTGAAAGTTAPATNTAKGTTLTIGVIESVTGAPGQTGRITAATDIMNAWAKQTNANGGINGHPVKVIAENDNADPAQAKSALTTLVQQDHVLAIVGQDASSTEPTWGPYILANKTPVIGGTAYSANWFTNPYFYPATTTVVSNVWGQPYTVKQQQPTGAKIASLLCSNATVCQGATKIISGAAQQLGIPIVYNQTADAAAVSYTPQCLAMKSSGATALIPSGINYVNVIRDCNRQGFHPLVITTNYGPTPSAIHQNSSTLVGLVGPAPAFPPFQAFPQTQGYFNLLKAYAPSYLPGGSAYNTTTLQGAVDAYVAAQAFAKGIENANIPASATATRTELVQGLSMFNNETLGGISPPLTYSNGTKPNPQVKCFYLYKTANTTAAYETVPANTLKTYCQP
jgi:branched-chain amino acid transport system substrate-binding protein